ncbi:hypothetical protein GCM10009547_10170 [Sporichthya brevicatena]|uniref:Uncharacterized protein n=1 Tax=Sporichthya brevicatena TaxID=171442 RepID=A0ABN1GEU8_9ACTN
MPDFRDYKTVQRWLEEPPGRGFQPVREDPAAKCEILEKFCAHIGVDPDTLIATTTDLVPTGSVERNKQLKALKQWVRAQELPDSQATKWENHIRGFFIKNGVKVLVRPYSDVYRRSPGERAARGLA